MGRKKPHKKGGGKKRQARGRGTGLEKEVLLIFSANPKKAFTDKQIVNHFLDEHKRAAIQEAILALLEKERIVVVPPGKLRFNSRSAVTEYEGVADMTRSGAAYVVCEGLEQDIYVAPRNTNRAFPGDRVRVERILSSRRSRWEGVITAIVERRREAFIGTVSAVNQVVFVIPDDDLMPVDFFIPEGGVGKARQNDKVVVRLKEWPEKAKNPIGEITDVLGPAGSSDIEMQSILVENGFRLKFPEEVLREVNKIPDVIGAEEIARRRDFRGVMTFTIDPEDAKDFDDALSLRKLENGHWEVGIHIADVSHYAAPGSALDQEALKRATSVYLVDRVLPMFPEQLSNVICSLRPREEKLCYSAVLELDERAEVRQEWFGRTVIFSDKRFTYEEAQEVLDGAESPYSAALLTLNALAHKLREKRFREGSINFDTVEVRFRLDDQAKPIGVYVKERKDAHMLVEDFMLLANKQVARFAGKEKNANGLVPLVYRVHDTPDIDKLNDFRLFAARFGYQIHLDNPRQITQSLNRFLAEVEGKPEQNLLENLAIRAMAKAVYSTKNIGHYGLGFSYYTHFTSPIRRYPDILVHRVLDAVLHGRSAGTAQTFEKWAVHCSERERAAMQAERESVKYKMAEYMQDHLGEPMEGVISGVKNWGIYVEIPAYNCEGMIKAEHLDDDIYVFNEREILFKGLKTGRQYQLGDAIMVTVDSVDLSRRTIDLLPL